MPRELLPNRRACVTVDFEHHGIRYSGSVGFYPDGRPGEVFLDAYKSGTDLQAVARDAAVSASLALQHGCDPAVLAAAMSKDADNRPAGAVNKLLSHFE